MKNLVHWDDVASNRRGVGDIGGIWTGLGEASGTVSVGLRRIRVEAGKRSTAVHVHGAEEEIFFVLGGSGMLWQGGSAAAVGAGDTIVHRENGEPHTLRAGTDGLDVLAFGTRVSLGICHLPRAGMAWAGPTVLAAPGFINLWEKDVAAGPLEMPEPGPRPANVVALESVATRRIDKGTSRFTLRAPGQGGGAVTSGLNHLTIDGGANGWPFHCHAAEEEILVVLDGDGTVTVGKEQSPVRRGHVLARPAGTGQAHIFEAGAAGITMLAYGTKEPNDITHYPRSGKIYLRGLGVVGRLEPARFWDVDDGST